VPFSYRSYRGYNYDPSYTSHAHGWSTGPTSALTFYVLGLHVASPQGWAWTLAPHLSGLPSAEGGFTTPLGWFGAKWAMNGRKFTLEVDTPEETSGTITWPVGGRTSMKGRMTDVEKGQVTEVPGGRHSFSVVSV
jgi:hypothetical protein